MKKVLAILVLLTVCWGCSSPYNVYKSEYTLVNTQSVSKEEAFSKLVKLIVKYKKENKIEIVDFGGKNFEKYIGDLNQTLNTKFKFKKITENGNKIQGLYMDDSCKDDSCMKGFYLEIINNGPLKVCEVKKVHKETSEESLSYLIFPFPISIVYHNPEKNKLDLPYLLMSLKLSDKVKMDEIAGLLKIIYNPVISCK